jgi:hypothetical protein
MRTLQEIKDQVAQEAGYKNWKDAGWELWPFSDEWHDNITRRYALAAIEEDRKDCAEKAKTISSWEIDEDTATSPLAHFVRVDKSSITDRPLPNLI